MRPLLLETTAAAATLTEVEARLISHSWGNTLHPLEWNDSLTYGSRCGQGAFVSR